MLESWERILRRRMGRRGETDKLAAWMATRSIKAEVTALAGDGKARVRQKALMTQLEGQREAASTDTQVHEHATAGVATPAQELPHRERLEGALGWTSAACAAPRHRRRC